MDHEQCAACGFDGSEYEPERLLDTIRGLGRNGFASWLRQETNFG